MSEQTPPKVPFPVEQIKARSGFTYWMPKQDERAKLLTYAKVYGAVTLASLKRLKPGAGLVLDVGANVGQTALTFSGWARQVQSFEADPNIYALLVRNLADNKVSNVKSENCALGAEQSEIRIVSTPTAHLGGHVGKGTMGTLVPLERLDDCVRLNTLVDVLKIDVEGYELKVLKGAQRILADSRPVIVLEQVPEFLKRYSDTPADIWTLLRARGYLAYTTDLAPLEDPTVVLSRMRDRIFVHESACPKRRGLFY